LELRDQPVSVDLHNLWRVARTRRRRGISKKKLLGVLAVGVFAWAGSATAGIDNANVTSYTATCTGLGTATSVRIERSLTASPNSRAGVAFHVVDTNQVVLFADTPGLVAKAEEAGTFCTVTAVNGESVAPFPAPIVVLPNA